MIVIIKCNGFDIQIGRVIIEDREITVNKTKTDFVKVISADNIQIIHNGYETHIDTIYLELRRVPDVFFKRQCLPIEARGVEIISNASNITEESNEPIKQVPSFLLTFFKVNLYIFMILPFFYFS